MVVRSRGTDFLVGLELPRSGATLVSLRLKSLCSRRISVRVWAIPVRVPRPAGRPIVLPATVPTVPRVAALGSRTPAIFSADRLVMLLVPIVLPIREVDFIVTERRFVADCFFAAGTEGVLLPITVPMFRLRSTLRCPVEVRSNDRLLFALDEVKGLVELTAGCLALVGAEELRVLIELPIRERWLVVGCFFAFERDGALRLPELPIREAPHECAAGCLALLGTDGLVVLIVLPIRDVMLGLILLLVLVAGLLVVTVRELLLPDGVLELIELPIRDVMLELILPFELLRVLELLRLDWLDVGELGRVVICRPNMLELGAVGRELIDRLDILLLGVRLVMDLLLLDWLLLILSEVEGLLGVRLVMALLDVLLLGIRLVMALLDVLLLGVRLVMALLEVLLLGVLLVMARLELLLLGVRLELRLDETLLERLDDDDLDVALGAGAGLETCRLCLLELLDLLLLDRVLAANTGSAISARISTKRTVNRGRKAEDRFPASDIRFLYSDFRFPASP